MRKLVATAVLVSALAAPMSFARSALAQSSPRPARAANPSDVAEPVAPAFDHTLFDGLLRAHVKDGLVDYAAFKGNADFARYLASLKSADLKGFEEAERIAFWLNVYNAYTIQLVASRGETESIRNINKTLGVFRLKGPWSEEFVQAAGRMLTLDDVQYRILQHDFSEPRVHFAMSFGAVGAPRLRSEAYTGPKLDGQLEDQAHTFIHETTKNRIDTTLITMFLSPVIARNRADFGKSNRELAKFLADYFEPGPERRFLNPPKSALARPAVVVARNDSSKPAKPNAAEIDEQIRQMRRFNQYIVELPLDWTLNIQKRP